MYPKTALKILLVIILAVAIVFGVLYVKNQFSPKYQEEQIGDIIDKKKSQQELTEEELEKLEAYVDQKVVEKRNELKKKTEEEIKRDGYSQDEVNFILDPQRTIEKELGIAEEKESKQLTQEEIDAILNPQN
jgi:ribosomal protein S13